MWYMYVHYIGNTVCKLIVPDMIEVLNFAIISVKFNIICVPKK